MYFTPVSCSDKLSKINIIYYNIVGRGIHGVQFLSWSYYIYISLVIISFPFSIPTVIYLVAQSLDLHWCISLRQIWNFLHNVRRKIPDVTQAMVYTTEQIEFYAVPDEFLTVKNLTSTYRWHGTRSQIYTTRRLKFCPSGQQSKWSA